MPTSTSNIDGQAIDIFTDELAEIACGLSEFEVRFVADELTKETLLPALDIRLGRFFASPHSTAKYQRIMQMLEGAPNDLPRAAIATMLAAAHRAAVKGRSEIKADLVLTGPTTNLVRMRTSEQVALEVIRGASRRVILMSYIVFLPDSLRTAIVEARARGVEVILCVDSPGFGTLESGRNQIAALARSLAGVAVVYEWPRENRPTENGTAASLHAKCVIADSTRIFIGSANLTEHAFHVNLEMGVLLSGGSHAADVENYFDEMIRLGTFVRHVA